MSGQLHNMFAAVPRRYDRINRLVTLGLDQGWRRRAARTCLEARPGSVLDLCTGTGDMPVILARMAPPEVELVAGDFVPEMLEAARDKARRAGVADRVCFELADAADLPFPEGRFDAVTITFGFRNLTYKNPGAEQHLAQIRRVLSPGGRLVFVESSQPAGRLMRAGFRAYLKAVVGPAGALVSGEAGAYRYLSSSIRNYYSADQVAALLEEAGFADVGYKKLLGGAAAIHWASRP